MSYADCCRHVDGAPLVRVAQINTPGADTRYSNPRCYLSSTGNCSQKISREHVISQAILEQLSEQGKVLVEGFPHQKRDDEAIFSIRSLASKVLCERHNNALSPLDAAAGHAFRQMGLALHYATKRSLARRPAFFLASGDGLERWSVKTLLGLFHAKIARTDGQVLFGSHAMDTQTAIRALLGNGLDMPLGMFVVPTVGGTIQEEMTLAPLTAPAFGLLAGLRVLMHTITFDMLIDRRGANRDFYDRPQFYRPAILDFDGPERSSRVVFTWSKYRYLSTRVSVTISDVMRAA